MKTRGAVASESLSTKTDIMFIQSLKFCRRLKIVNKGGDDDDHDDDDDDHDDDHHHHDNHMF